MCRTAAAHSLLDGPHEHSVAPVADAVGRLHLAHVAVSAGELVSGIGISAKAGHLAMTTDSGLSVRGEEAGGSVASEK